MAYTSLAKIERDKALAQALRGNMGQEILPNWASGLAYVLNQYGANKRSNRAAEMEAENERLYSEDLATALRGGDELPGPTQSGQPLMRQYQTPQGQMTALQRALQYDEMQNQREIAGLRAGGVAGFGNTVVTMMDAQGNYIPARVTPEGLTPLNVPGLRYIPDAGRLGYDPEAIMTRRGAETEAEVQNIEATAAPSAQAAGMETAAETAAKLEAERAAEAPKKRAAADAVMFEIDQTIGLIDSITSDPAFNQAFGIDFFRGMVPGSAALGVSKSVDTLLNRNFVNAINAIKQASGAGLGSVTEREGARLENMIRPVDRLLSDEDAKANLLGIRAYLENLRNNVSGEFDSVYGSAGQGGLTPEEAEELRQLEAELGGR